jgi:hypothetical protein
MPPVFGPIPFGLRRMTGSPNQISVTVRTNVNGRQNRSASWRQEEHATVHIGQADNSQ